ncbi:TerB family tellurite resistance protein [Ascidiimonas sp. W6]|uniref:TerB family tellurite resistance protein n=1 Tax=Ascidiimonas meishanensis TaxID=3128903 RepID=UPI0030ED2B6E
MDTESEKLSLLADMITFAKSDQEVKDSEYNFLLAVASQLGVTKRTFDHLFGTTAKRTPIKPESERILQFHRLILLMNVDGHQHPEELRELRNYGLKMGLHPQATETVLKIMDQYPNKIIPPDILFQFSKRTIIKR